METARLLLGALALGGLGASLAAPGYTQVRRGADRLPGVTPPSPLDSGGISARPRPAPQGPYRLTCRDIRMDVAMLHASCNFSIPRGVFESAWQSTSLDTSECFSVDAIRNDRGDLDCSPAGPYHLTCRYIQSYRSQDAVAAICSGAPLFASGESLVRNDRLERVSSCREGTIQYLNGVLTCDRR